MSIYQIGTQTPIVSGPVITTSGTFVGLQSEGLTADLGVTEAMSTMSSPKVFVQLLSLILHNLMGGPAGFSSSPNQNPLDIFPEESCQR
jgi:hypothetical protein